MDAFARNQLRQNHEQHARKCSRIDSTNDDLCFLFLFIEVCRKLWEAKKYVNSIYSSGGDVKELQSVVKWIKVNCIKTGDNGDNDSD